jgi:hypothetical protein
MSKDSALNCSNVFMGTVYKPSGSGLPVLFFAYSSRNSGNLCSTVIFIRIGRRVPVIGRSVKKDA